MFTSIEGFLKSKVNEFVFIELKDDEKLKAKGFPSIKNTPLPIPINEVVGRVKEDINISDISLLKIIEGMIFLTGIDSNFIHNETYKNFLQAFDKNIDDTIVKQGLKYVDIEKKIEGLICFKSSLHLNSDNLDALYNYGRCCEELSKGNEDEDKFSKALEDEALEVFEKIASEYPDFPLSYYHLGFYYANKSLYKKAELTWEIFIEKNEDENKEMEVLQMLAKLDPKIKFEEGYNSVLNGEPGKALEILLPLGDVYPEWWNLLFFIGLAYRYLEKYTDALKYFEQILNIEPSQGDTLNEIGLCYISSGKVLEAKKYFKKALIVNNDDPEILCNLGVSYMENGEYEKAEEYLKKSFDINPEDDVTQACMQKLDMLIDNKN